MYLLRKITYSEFSEFIREKKIHITQVSYLYFQLGILPNNPSGFLTTYPHPMPCRQTVKSITFLTFDTYITLPRYLVGKCLAASSKKGQASRYLPTCYIGQVYKLQYRNSHRQLANIDKEFMNCIISTQQRVDFASSVWKYVF